MDLRNSGVFTFFAVTAEFITEKLLFSALAFLTYFIFRFFRIRKAKKIYTITPQREIAAALFFLYLIILASITVVPYYEISSEGFRFTGVLSTWSGEYFRQHMNLTPFMQIRLFHRSLVNHGISINFIINILGNIAVFIPLGLLPPLLWKMKIRSVIFLSFLSSCLIEILQIPQLRATDVDDVILNTPGGIIGVLLYCLLNKLFPEFCKKFKKTKN